MNLISNKALQTKLVMTAHLYRLGREAEATQSLGQCIELLEPLFPHLSQKPLMACMSETLAAQERFDWLAVADYLEYELVELLEANA
jgi:hypothetical protein